MSPITMRHLPIILVLFVAVIGCKYLRPAQKLSSEVSDATPVQTVGDSKITLNNEPYGKLADLVPLKRKVSEVMKWREANGVFIESTNEIENTIYVMVDPNISVGKVAELMLAISENNGKAIIPIRAVRDENTASGYPNPLTLVVKTENAVGELFPHYVDGEKRMYAYSPRFEFVEKASTLKIHRLTNNSIEISANDHNFLNEKVNIMPDSDPDIIDVKQRAISASDLEPELSKIVSGEKRLRIIASEKASYAGLLKVFEAAERLNVDFEVLVRKHYLKTRR